MPVADVSLGVGPTLPPTRKRQLFGAHRLARFLPVHMGQEDEPPMNVNITLVPMEDTDPEVEAARQGLLRALIQEAHQRVSQSPQGAQLVDRPEPAPRSATANNREAP